MKKGLFMLIVPNVSVLGQLATLLFGSVVRQPVMVGVCGRGSCSPHGRSQREGGRIRGRSQDPFRAILLMN